jgi:uncharacterized protein (DUF2062 family)
MIQGFIKTSGRIWRASIAKLAVILIKPVLHALHPPEYTARAIGVGLFVAFTPTFGIQIPIVFLLWTTAKIVNGDLAFNPVLAMAWTWFTNVFTVPPLYFVFVQTGRFMLGRWEHIQSYDSYLPRFEQTAFTNTGWIEGMWIQAISLLAEFGVPLFVGSLPWAIGIGVFGYMLSLRLVRRHRVSVSQKQQ